MEKILDIVDIIANENGLHKDSVLSILKESIIKMAKKEISPHMNFYVLEDRENKDLKLTRKMLIVDDEDYNEEQKETHIPLSEAKNIADNVGVNDELEYQVDLYGMSNSAINSIFFDIKNQIQRLNEKQIISKYEKFLGRIVSGRVVHIDENQNTYVEIDNVRAKLSQKNRIKGEHFEVGAMVKSILKFIGFNNGGVHIELSRTTPKMIEELLRSEVPEINDGDVDIIKVVRIPGIKAKVLLNSNRSRVDAVGSAVGNKGVRIMAISKELNGENIDCIEYTNIPGLLVQRALSPAKIHSVSIEDSVAIADISEEEKSKAIGRSGVNIRLASMITGYEIKLREIEESRSEEKTGIAALESLFKK